MNELVTFLSKLGNLHDCTVMQFEWLPEKKSVIFVIEDIYFNFKGLPEYRGPVGGRIALEGVRRIDIELRGIEGHLRIDDMSVIKEDADTSTISTTFWPTGKIGVAFQHASFPALPAL
jgi:hypothetical protein